MSTDSTAIVGFGIDLGKTRPSAVFGPGSAVPNYEFDERDTADHPVETVSHAFAAYSSDMACYFLFVPGTAQQTSVHEVNSFDTTLDPVKVQRFIDWCRENGLREVEPRWLFTCCSW